MSKKTYLLIIILVVVAALTAAFIIAGRSDRSASDGSASDISGEVISDEDIIDEEEEEGNGIVFEEEDEDADIVPAESKESDFYGTWEAVSDYALYLYGNFELTIEPGGKWRGNITDENMTGKWKMEGNSMHVVNDWIDVSLVFTPDGTLVMQRNAADEDEDESTLNTVMVRK